jgi:hypothetical protein
VPILMRMTQVSLIGYAVGGTFLSLANHDLPYYIVGFVIATDGIMRRRAKELQAKASQVQAPKLARREAAAQLPQRNR